MPHRQRINVPGADKAYENVLKWLAREEWQELCAKTIDEHVGAACDEFDLDPDSLEEELGPDVYGVVMGCAIEDALTRGNDAGVNAIDDYLKRRGWREGAPGRRYLEALRDSVMSLYEVVDVVPGSHLVLRDLVRGGVLPFEFEAAEAELERLRDTCRRGQEELAKQAREEEGGRSPPPPPEVVTEVILSHWAPHFTQAWLADEMAGSDEAGGERTNADGEPLVLAAARFPRRGGMAAIEARLDGAAPRLARNDEEQEREGELTWDWCRAALPAPAAAAAAAAPTTGGEPEGEEEPDDREPLGLVVLNEGGVVLLTNSVERAERGRAFLAELLGALVGEAAIERFPIDEVLAAGGGEPGAGASGAEPGAAAEEPDPEALAAKLAAVNDEAYRGMLTEPVAELDGKTPREAAAGADEEGRARLVAWLKRLENDDAHLAKAIGVPAYDFRWMWAELGVADRRR